MRSPDHSRAAAFTGKQLPCVSDFLMRLFVYLFSGESGLVLYPAAAVYSPQPFVLTDRQRADHVLCLFAV